MAEITFYSMSGKIKGKKTLNFETLEPDPLGEMARVTLKDGTVHEGYVEEPYIRKGISSAKQVDYMTLFFFDVDPKTYKPRSSNLINKSKFPLKEIAKMEAILYSNPRWGHPPLSKFEFFK